MSVGLRQKFSPRRAPSHGKYSNVNWADLGVFITNTVDISYIFLVKLSMHNSICNWHLEMS